MEARNRDKWIFNVKKFNMQILENLDLPGFLLYAQQHGGLSANQMEMIKGPDHPSEQVQSFVKMFKDMTNECMQNVILGLDRNGQEHISLLITEGKDTTMTRKHKKFLTKNRIELTENIDIDNTELLDALQQEEVFVTYDVECIRDKGGQQKKAAILIDRLLKKPDKAYEHFIESLRISGQDYIADLLQHTDVSDEEEETFQQDMVDLDRGRETQFSGRNKGFKKVDYLGQGTYGKVELWNEILTKKDRAVKIIPMDPNEETQKRFMKEGTTADSLIVCVQQWLIGTSCS